MEKLITIKELSTMIGLKDSHIRSMVQRKTIPYVKLGIKILFDKEEILAWVEQNKNK